MRYETYRDKNSEWHWRCIAVNGDIAGESTERYKDKETCEIMMDKDRERRLRKVKERPIKKEKSLLKRVIEFIWGSED